MEEIVLSFLFPREELNIVHNQKVNASVEIGEFVYAVGLDGFDELNGEFFARNIDDPLRLAKRDSVIAQGMHEVSLPAPYLRK